jgi:hypothetical protein
MYMPQHAYAHTPYMSPTQATDYATVAVVKQSLPVPDITMMHHHTTSLAKSHELQNDSGWCDRGLKANLRHPDQRKCEIA